MKVQELRQSIKADLVFMSDYNRGVDLYLHYIPVIFFILLAVFLLQKAISSNARRSLSWGRSGGKVPVSRTGYAVWGSTFIIIAGILFKRHNIPVIFMLVLGVCFLAIIGIGIRDTFLYRKKSMSKLIKSNRKAGSDQA